MRGSGIRRMRTPHPDRVAIRLLPTGEVKERALDSVGAGFFARCARMGLGTARELCRLGEFLCHPIALELGNMIDEKHAIEMIDLMLQTRGEQPIGFDLVRLSLEIEIVHLDASRTLDLFVIFRDRQAAFLIDAFLFRAPDDFRIDEDLRLRRLVLLG
jgi:hypothetical protein